MLRRVRQGAGRVARARQLDEALLLQGEGEPRGALQDGRVDVVERGDRGVDVARGQGAADGGAAGQGGEVGVGGGAGLLGEGAGGVDVALGEGRGGGGGTGVGGFWSGEGGIGGKTTCSPFSLPLSPPLLPPSLSLSLTSVTKKSMTSALSAPPGTRTAASLASHSSRGMVRSSEAWGRGGTGKREEREGERSRWWGAGGGSGVGIRASERGVLPRGGSLLLRAPRHGPCREENRESEREREGRSLFALADEKKRGERGVFFFFRSQGGGRAKKNDRWERRALQPFPPKQKRDDYAAGEDGGGVGGEKRGEKGGEGASDEK